MFRAVQHVLGHGLIGLRGLACERSWRVTERASRAELDGLQSARLQRLMRVAKKVPYWQDLLRGEISGLHGKSARAQLAKFPVLTKATVREQGQRMLLHGRNGNGARWCSTGGSTGEPLRLAKDVSTRVAGNAASLRGFRWLGVNPGTPTVQVMGFEQASWLGHLRCHAMNLRLADPLGHDQNNGPALVSLIRGFRPKCLIGYPTALLKLAELAADAGLRVPVIFSTGEMLYPDQRKALETVFAARVAEYYGSNEVNGLAYECERGRRHVTEEHVIMETVDNAGQPVWDQPGRILVTDLDNHVMPLLRYELGDVGVLTREPCPCGRSLLVLKELQGRRQDLLRNARGAVLPAIFFAGQFRNLRGLRAYQVVQKQLDEVTLRYVPCGPEGVSEVDALCAGITRQLGSELRVQREVCESIPLTPRGKTRLVVGMDSQFGQG